MNEFNEFKESGVVLIKNEYLIKPKRKLFGISYFSKKLIYKPNNIEMFYNDMNYTKYIVSGKKVCLFKRFIWTIITNYKSTIYFKNSVNKPPQVKNII